MKTKLPSAIVYNWDRLGEDITLWSDIYFEENLYDRVIIHSIPYTGNIIEDYSKYKPDVIISFGKLIKIDHVQLQQIYFNYNDIIHDNILANDIVCQTTFKSIKLIPPKFSIFTPTYNTGIMRIMRAYNSLANQTYKDWEWVIVDDSTNDDAFKILQDISNKDYRVKLHRILPQSNGNIGLAKHRASMLCQGDWLVELDHDDTLVKDCLSICNDAILKFPDAGFLYSDCSEIYEDGTPKYYSNNWNGNWYAVNNGSYCWGYAGHSCITVDDKNILAHWCADINPLTVRFNIGMPNHVRVWNRKIYLQVGGHNVNIPIADDFELFIKTFLHTRIIHIKKVLYLQYDNRNSSVGNNCVDINRRARLIRDYYDLVIHNRIIELGFKDWNWDNELGHSQKSSNKVSVIKYYEEEQIMNYIYE